MFVTKQDAALIDQKKWLWLAANPVDQYDNFSLKYSWPGWEDISFIDDLDLYDYCMGCWWDMITGIGNCKNCLWRWGAENRKCVSAMSPYRAWCDATTVEAKVHYAKILAMLPINLNTMFNSVKVNDI